MVDITVEVARQHLRLESNDDDANVTLALEEAKSFVNSYLYPKKYTDFTEEDDFNIAKRAILYALYQFYYERVPKSSHELNQFMVYTLQPIRTLRV